MIYSDYNDITYSYDRTEQMRKFEIPNIPSGTNKSIRFPNNVIDEVEARIRGKDCTFSAFVVEAVRVALDNLREEDSEKET